MEPTFINELAINESYSSGHEEVKELLLMSDIKCELEPLIPQ